MFVPENPILFPKPKLVQCPRESCGAKWYWRTWWQGKSKTACSSCKSTITPVEAEPDEDSKTVKLIKCPACGKYQWYVGNKDKTSCTSNGCKKKNVPVVEITFEEIKAIIRAYTIGAGAEELEYYQQRVEEYGQ